MPPAPDPTPPLDANAPPQPPRGADAEATTLPPRIPDVDATLPPSGPAASPAPAPQRVAGYDILGELGRGGMGVVYQARQVRLDRVVALKMVLAGGHAGEQELARFRIEAEAVARLQHPNIVQIHEVGEQDGLPFFSLEYVDGGSLAQRVQDGPLPGREAAGLVEALARAMHFAHQRGVIHRDLKPANVLLTADGQPKITDFGLAKRADSGKGQTHSGSVLGTPSYMAPEQAGGKTHEITSAVDVYALGAILYELLTGRPPFRAATPLDTVLQVLTEEPVAPSRLRPKLPRDLETVCLKCLHKEPGKRYPSAEALADDLRRFQGGEPVHARPVGSVERAVKWARRRPAVAGLVAVSLAAAVLLLAGGVWYNARLQDRIAEAERERLAAAEANRQAEEQRRAAADARREAGGLRDEARQIKADADRQRERAGRLETDVRRNLYFVQFGLARRAFEDNHIDQAVDFLQALRPAGGEPDFRGFEWYYLWKQCHADRRTLFGHAGAVTSLAFTPDGKRLASASADGTVKVWDVATGREALTLKGPAVLRRLALRPDGKRLAAVGDDKVVHVWDLESGREVHSLAGHTGWLWGVAYSADGMRIASAGDDKTVKVWDDATGKEVLRFAAHYQPIRAVCFSPDGKLLATGADDARIKLWDAATGAELRTLHGHTNHVWSLAFNRDGTRLLSASLDGTARLWDVATGHEAVKMQAPTGQLMCAAFSPDGKSVATAGEDTAVRVWDTGGKERFVLRGHANGLWPVAFSPDGKLLASGDTGGVIRLWDAAPPDARTLPTYYWSVAFSPDGKHFATGGTFFGVKIVETETGRYLRTLFGLGGEVTAVAYAPDGRRVAGVGSDGQARVWDADTGKPLHVFTGHTGVVFGVAFSRDGTRLATCGEDQTVKVWDVRPGAPREAKQPLQTLTGLGAIVRAVAYSPDGRLLATGTWGNAAVKLWDAPTGKEVRALTGPGQQVNAVAFSPDGRRLAAAGAELVKVWDVATGDEALTLRGHSREVWGVAFSPDGRRIASCSGERRGQWRPGEVKVWDAATGAELLMLPGNTSTISGVAFSPDGRHLATATIGTGTAVKLWDAPAPASSHTDGWPVLFADDFRRAEVGPRWAVTQGRWSVAGGALRGVLAPGTGAEEGVNVAAIDYRGEHLPDTAEVRFDCHTEGEVNCDAKLLDDRDGNGLMALLLSRAVPFNFKGAAVVVKAGDRYNPVSRNSAFALRPGQRYHVRVVHEPGRLTLFVDGVEVVSAPVAPWYGPVLRLQGGHGEPGDAVVFENLQVRAPREAVHRLQVRQRTQKLCDQLVFRKDVLARLEQDAFLSDADHRYAREVLEFYREEPEALSAAAWDVVRKPGASAEAVALALRQAEASCAARPKGRESLDALGVAQYRAGKYEAALATLARAEEITRAETGTCTPWQLAVRAMSQQRLGRAAAARETLRRLRDFMRSESWAKHSDAPGFVREAEALVGVTLPPPTAEEKEQEAIKDAVLRSEQAGWFHGDLAAFLAVCTDDYREIIGRGEEPGPYDMVLSRKQLEAARPLQFRQLAGFSGVCSFEGMRVELHGDEAVFRQRSNVATGTYFETYEEVNRLRRTPAGWKVYERRSRSRARHTDATTTFDAATLRKLDEAVDKARGKRDRHELAGALKEARRSAEAYAVMRELTRDPKAPATDWVERAELAMQVGEAADCLASVQKAAALDAKAVPKWMASLVPEPPAGR